MPVDLGGLLGTEFIQKVIEACGVCMMLPGLLGVLLGFLCEVPILICAVLGLLCCGVGALPGLLCALLDLAGCVLPSLICVLPGAIFAVVGEECVGLIESCPLFSLAELCPPA